MCLWNRASPALRLRVNLSGEMGQHGGILPRTAPAPSGQNGPACRKRPDRQRAPGQAGARRVLECGPSLGTALDEKGRGPSRRSRGSVASRETTPDPKRGPAGPRTPQPGEPYRPTAHPPAKSSARRLKLTPMRDGGIVGYASKSGRIMGRESGSGRIRDNISGLRYGVLKAICYDSMLWPGPFKVFGVFVTPCKIIIWCAIEDLNL